ncbi:RNA-directed DNA polymerase from mobile element jockey-like [Brachionus plicatilis]|uniref:RNA-directed DNA polymerase from mobile element jockey-like n=1 Tax=Brachionus plicatilis TaxID=10195 RepID=A0A3M7R2P6_BRAPC|nr:RNA-directed DNA polymerase from mobile element jockey-like [Brachionus plicatilis]
MSVFELLTSGNWPVSSGNPSAATLKYQDCIKELAASVKTLVDKVKTLEETNVAQLARIETLEKLSSDQEKIISEQSNRSNEQASTAPRQALDWNKIWEKNEKEEVIFLAKVSRELKTKESKENNIIISGLKEKITDNEEEKRTHDLKELGEKLEVLNIPERTAKRSMRIRKTKQNDKPALFLVEFHDKRSQMTAIANASNLKDSNKHRQIYINKDLTPAELEAEKSIRFERDRRNSELTQGEGRLKYERRGGVWPDSNNKSTMKNSHASIHPDIMNKIEANTMTTNKIPTTVLPPNHREISYTNINNSNTHKTHLTLSSSPSNSHDNSVLSIDPTRSIEIFRSTPEYPTNHEYRNRSSDESIFSTQVSSQSSPSSSSCLTSHSSVLASLNSSSQQNLNVNLHSFNAGILLGCIYRPPSENTTFYPSNSDIAIANSIDSTTKLLKNKNHSSIILMGDFNLPQIEWNEDGAPLLQDVSKTCNPISIAISNSSLVQMVKEETFFCNEQPTSQLDLVLVSNPNCVSEVKIGPPLDGNASNYHCSLIFELHSRASRSQTFDSRSLNWRSGDFMAMSEYFSNNIFRKASHNGCAQDLYSDFLNTFGEAAKLFVKRRRVKPLNSKPPWWNSEIASLVRQKRRVFIWTRINRHSEQLASRHRYLCKLVKYVVKKSIIEYELKLVESAKRNPKLVYTYMNRHYSSRESIAALMDCENHIVTDKVGICEILNAFFFSVFEPPTSREAVIIAKANFKVKAKPDPNFSVDDVVTPDKSFVRPHLEFAVGAWNPYRRGDIDVLEQVQRRFSKLVPELKSKPYLARREALGWSTLEERRRRSDLIQLHKIQHGHDRVTFVNGDQKLASDGLDSPAGNTRTCHKAIERQLIRNCGVRYNFFTNRTAGNWNALDVETKCVTNTNIFKNRIDKLLNFF